MEVSESRYIVREGGRGGEGDERSAEYKLTDEQCGGEGVSFAGEVKVSFAFYAKFLLLDVIDTGWCVCARVEVLFVQTLVGELLVEYLANVLLVFQQDILLNRRSGEGK